MERLTQRAKKVLSLAHQEAERMRHGYIGTEHLLLGLIMEDGGVASRVLRELGLETNRLAELVEYYRTEGENWSYSLSFYGRWIWWAKCWANTIASTAVWRPANVWR